MSRSSDNEAIHDSHTKAAERERDEARAEVKRLQAELKRRDEALCSCVMLEEGSYWSADCPLHGADSHKAYLAANAKVVKLGETVKMLMRELAQQRPGRTDYIVDRRIETALSQAREVLNGKESQ